MSFQSFDELAGVIMGRLMSDAHTDASAKRSENPLHGDKIVLNSNIPVTRVPNTTDMLRKKIADIRSGQKEREFLTSIEEKMLKAPFTEETVFRISYPQNYRESLLEKLENFGFVIKSSIDKRYLYWSLSKISTESIYNFCDLDS